MTHDKITAYSEAHTSPEPEVLSALNRATYAKMLHPRMISGHFQGRLLAMITQMIRPENILEIGTFTGYSALCLAEGLTENGRITTLEANEEYEDFIREHFEKANLAHRIELLIGDAGELLPKLEKTYDLVFLDADKRNYSKYYDLVFEKVRPGGFIIADNVLWSGKVADTAQFTDLDTKFITEFNQKIQNDPRVENILLPIRDGLMIIRKIA